MQAKTPFYFRGRKTSKPPYSHAQTKLRLALVPSRDDWEDATEDAYWVREAFKRDASREACEWDADTSH